MTKTNRNDSSNAETLLEVVDKTRARANVAKLLDDALVGYSFACVGAVVYVALGAALERLNASALDVVVTTFAIGTFATLASFFANRKSRFDAAKAIDARYDLDDRALTAVELLERAKVRPLDEYERLQTRDAAERAQRVSPREVVSLKPRGSRARVAFLCLACLVLTLALRAPRATEALESSPDAISVAVSGELRDNFLAPILELADANPNDNNLRRLADSLTELVDRFDQNLDDPKEGTAIIAKMEEEVRRAIAAGADFISDKSTKELGRQRTGHGVLSPEKRW